MDSKKIKKIIYPLIFTFFSIFAISANGSVSSQQTFIGKLKEEMNGTSIVYLIAAVVIFYLYYKKYDFYRRNRSLTMHVLALLFAATMIIGLSYSVNGNWTFIFNGEKQFLIAMIVFVGYYFLAEVVITWIFAKMETVTIMETVPTHHFLRWVDRHFFLFAFLVIVLLWSPFLIAYLPGTVPTDGYFQIRQAFGFSPMTNHHPWLMAYIYGALMKIGFLSGNDNFAVFFTVIVLYIVQALCYSEVCMQIKKHGNLIAGGVSLLFFAIIPFFGAYAQDIFKDNIFTAFFALFIAWCMDLCFEDPDTINKRTLVFKVVRLFVIGVLVCQTRNNGIYMVIPELFVLIFVFRKKLKKYALIIMIGTYICYSALSLLASNVLGIADGSIKEMLSIPFQQTARYLLEYPDDVTEEEAQAIDAVLDYENLAELYNPQLSDPVKATYKEDDDALNEYFKAWFSMFKKHPDAYIEATINNTYGYYYAFNVNTYSGIFFDNADERYTVEEFNFYHIMPEKIRTAVYDYVFLWRKLPVLSQLINPGVYTWLVLVLAGYLIRKRKIKQMLFMLGPAINILVCIASPVNGLVRYALPLMACAPILVFWALNTKGCNTESA